MYSRASKLTSGAPGLVRPSRYVSAGVIIVRTFKAGVHGAGNTPVFVIVAAAAYSRLICKYR